MNDYIKIDGHKFTNRIIEVNMVEPGPPQYIYTATSICINCNFEIFETLSFIKENGIQHIMYNDDYLTCNEMIIKKLLE